MASDFEIGDPLDFESPESPESNGCDDEQYLLVCCNCGLAIHMCGNCMREKSRHIKCACYSKGE